MMAKVKSEYKNIIAKTQLLPCPGNHIFIYDKNQLCVNHKCANVYAYIIGGIQNQGPDLIVIFLSSIFGFCGQNVNIWNV